MSTKKIDLAKLSPAGADKAVAAIHQTATDKSPVEQIVRTTVDIPKSIHRRIKMKIYEKDLTIRDYFLELIRKDLNL